MGEDFCNMVAYTDWKMGSTTLPFFRVGRCATQVTAPVAAVKDGISRMVLKCDFDKLKQKKMSSEVFKAEQLMAIAWDTLANSELTFEKKALLFGKLQIRLVLQLLGKELKGREGVQYKDMDAVTQKFEEEVKESNDCASAPGASNQKLAEPVKSLEDATDPKAIALNANKHIKLNKLYVFKKDPAKVWKLVALTDTVANLVHKPFFEPEEQQGVLHSELKDLKEWKKDAPELVNQALVKKLSPSVSLTLTEELHRCKAQCALFEKHSEQLGCLKFWKHFLALACESKSNLIELRLGDPQVLVSNHHQVFTSAKINKNKLILLPMGTLQLLPMDKIQKNHCIIRCSAWTSKSCWSRPSSVTL